MATNASPPIASDERLRRILELIRRSCRGCGDCVSRCIFLQRYGTPAAIVRDVEEGSFAAENAFACNLCQLCAAGCRDRAAPHELFLELRRACVRGGRGEYPEHREVIAFEKQNVSRRATWYGVPFGGTRVFFPGCSLSGTRPMAVRKAFELLRQVLPGIGIVLDCCGKPSHDLGRDATFRTLFGDMRRWLNDAGVDEVVTGCPGCQQVFDTYGGGLKVRSLYEVLDEHPEPLPQVAPGTRITLHDPCTARHAGTARSAVRRFAARLGLSTEELPHHGAATLCCGKGGSAHRYAPSLAETWTHQLATEAGPRTVVTWCGSCQARFQGRFRASHLLDFLTHPDQAARGEFSSPIPTLFQLNRLRLKHYLRRHLDAARERERTIPYPAPGESPR